MALSMRESIGMSDMYTLSGQNVYVSLVERPLHGISDEYRILIISYTVDI